jgi:alpha-D-ribose 1-methylphosphonate 5-triphosphate diphosphatase
MLRIVGADAVLPGEVARDCPVLIENGRIAAIGADAGAAAEEIRLPSGTLLLPGFVDLHGDAIEKAAEPRPGAAFPLPLAVAEADRRAVAAGITTAFHALSFAGGALGLRSAAGAAALARAVVASRGRLLGDARLHLRYEVTEEGALPTLLDLLAEGIGDLVSLMDHTPGRGQFRDLAAWVAFQARSYGRGAAEAAALAAAAAAGQAGAGERATRLAAAARAAGIALASHDDDDPAMVAALRGLGIGISEFPVTLAAAAAAREAGLASVVGAPNVVRGGSQAGGLSAAEAIALGHADCLCSDYAPQAMLPAVLRLAEDGVLPLHAAAALAAAAPAAAAGFPDRGRIACGLRADLLATPATGWREALVSAVWVQGRLKLRVENGCHGN